MLSYKTKLNEFLFIIYKLNVFILFIQFVSSITFSIQNRPYRYPKSYSGQQIPFNKFHVCEIKKNIYYNYFRAFKFLIGDQHKINRILFIGRIQSVSNNYCIEIFCLLFHFKLTFKLHLIYHRPQYV